MKTNHISRRNSTMRKLFGLSLHETFDHDELIRRSRNLARNAAANTRFMEPPHRDAHTRAAHQLRRNLQWLVAHHIRYNRAPGNAYVWAKK